MAGERYLELVVRGNCSSELSGLTWYEVAGDDGFYEWEWVTVRDAMRPHWEAGRDASLEMMNGLLDYEWPPGMQEDIDDLVTELASDAGDYDELVRADTFDQYLVVEFGDRSAATVVRAKLALPSNIDSDVEHCREYFADE